MINIDALYSQTLCREAMAQDSADRDYFKEVLKLIEISDDKSIKSFRQYNGVAENLRRCAEPVYGDSWSDARQCSRRRGYGRGRRYCKQHARRSHVRAD